jgi:hypothetical protein
MNNTFAELDEPLNTDWTSLDESLHNDWTSFIEKLAKGTNNDKAHEIVEKYKKGEYSDIPPNAKAYLDSIRRGGACEKSSHQKRSQTKWKKTKKTCFTKIASLIIFFIKRILFTSGTFCATRSWLFSTPLFSRCVFFLFVLPFDL